MGVGQPVVVRRRNPCATNGRPFARILVGHASACQRPLAGALFRFSRSPGARDRPGGQALMPTPGFDTTHTRGCNLCPEVPYGRPAARRNHQKVPNYGDNLPSFGGNIMGKKSHDYSFSSNSGTGNGSVMKLKRHGPARSHAGDDGSGGLNAARAHPPAAGTAHPNGTDDGELVYGRPPGKRPRVALCGAPGAPRQLGEAVFGYGLSRSPMVLFSP